MFRRFEAVCILRRWYVRDRATGRVTPCSDEYTARTLAAARNLVADAGRTA